MNNIKEILVIVGGIFTLGIAIFHLQFWRIFKWNTELQLLMPVNRAIMQVLNLCLTFLFIGFAYISFSHTHELVSSSLGNAFISMVAIFWILRSFYQWYFFNLKSRTSILFFILSLLISADYIAILFL